MFRLTACCVLTTFLSLYLLARPATSETQPGGTRTANGLIVLYDFTEGEGDTIFDRSRVGKPLNLKIETSSATQWRDDGLRVTGKARIRSVEPAGRINEAVKRTEEISVEAWVTPADLELAGPARIVTISRDPNVRNVTLGQDRDRFEVRLRTQRTSTNGIPSTSSAAKSVQRQLTHVVFTRNRGGKTTIYIDGQVNAEGQAGAKMYNWDPSFHLGLANELADDRAWQGTFHLVAVYGRALSPHDVLRNYQAGADAASEQASQQASRDPHAEFFETQVAAVLVKHCFECHDPATKEGGLDLSRKASVFKGGETGPALVAGKSSDSLLWQLVADDSMPPERTPLNDAEKQILKTWIDNGAVWSLEQIDPVVYAHGLQVAQNWVRRLTVPEYIATIESTFGVDVATEAQELLPPDLRADGFSNTAYNLNVDLEHVAAYAQLASIVVDKLDVNRFAGQFTNKRRLEDDEMRDLIAKMGKWILRGQLTDPEIVSYRGIGSTVASSGGNWEDAVAYIIEAMIQSPRFLYRIESHKGDGSRWPVSGYELASRISYIVWGSSPDKELLRAAEAGELFDEQKLDEQLRRLLSDERAIEQSVRFVSEWLNLGRLANLRPNQDHFPDWNPALADQMRRETQSFFQEIVWNQRRPLSDLINAQTTFLTPELARHYNIDLSLDEFEQVSLADVPSRGGILTHGSVLTVGGDEASMVSRGLFVLHDLLRGTVKDPPPCVDTTPIPTKPGLTQRGIALERLANQACGGCHSKFEPLAFALEKFDGLGTYHEVDQHGNPLREDGEILFPGEENPVSYKTASELMDLLADSPRVQECLTWKVTQFALGRPLVAGDVSEVAKIHQQSQQHGGTWHSLISAIVKSDLVQTIQTETAP